jgi:hypothetical protein
MLDGAREGNSAFAVPVHEDYTAIRWSRPEREDKSLSGVEPNLCTTHCIR